MVDERKDAVIGVDAQQFIAIALEARRRDKQDLFLDFAMQWASDANDFIEHLVNLLDQNGIKCICRTHAMSPDCPIHNIPPKDLLKEEVH